MRHLIVYSVSWLVDDIFWCLSQHYSEFRMLFDHERLELRGLLLLKEGIVSFFRVGEPRPNSAPKAEPLS